MASRPSRRRLITYGLSWTLLLSCLWIVSGAIGQAAAPNSAPIVKLEIDYNDGIHKDFDSIPWKQDMTVQDAMNVAKATGHGIQYQSTGSGDTAFLTQIDDIKNQGGGSDSHNWLYRVNDKLANVGFGVYKLNAGDVVVWKFDVYHQPAQ
jgi:hypothetical protein